MKLLKILLLCLFTTTACAQPLKKVTVILDWFVNPDHAPLFVAQQQGYFAKQGLDVNIVTPADPNDGPKLVAANQADMTIDYQAGLLLQSAQGLPLMRVGTLFPLNLNVLVVLKNGPIKTMKDFKGKTVGTSITSLDQGMLDFMLHNVGLTRKDITLVNVNYNLVQALLTHKVDAISGVMRNVEPVEIELAGQPVRMFSSQDYGVPVSESAIWVVNSAHAHDPWVNQFLTAIQQGTAYLQKNPESTWKAFAAAYPENNNEQNHQSWLVTYKLFATDPWHLNAKQYQAFAQFLHQQGLLKTVPALSSYTLMGK